jgi:hypothetical protein
LNRPAPGLISMMSRRSALRSAAALAAAGSLARAESPAATRKGRVNHAVCRWCYNKIPLEELCRAAKSMGIAGIDLLSLDQVPVARAHGLACSLLSGVPGGIGKGLNRPEHHDAIVAWFEEAAPAAAALGVTNLIVFSGNRDGLDDDAGLENCAAGIKRLLPICEKHGVVAIMELLNSKVNHPDYMRPHPLGCRFVQIGGLAALQTALRHLPHADHGGRRDPHHPGTTSTSATTIPAGCRAETKSMNRRSCSIRQSSVPLSRPDSPASSRRNSSPKAPTRWPRCGRRLKFATFEGVNSRLGMCPRRVL